MENINKNENQFVLVFDKEVANRLITDGYTLLSEKNDRFTFINDGKLKFSENEDVAKTMNKIHYTNVLCM